MRVSLEDVSPIQTLKIFFKDLFKLYYKQNKDIVFSSIVFIPGFAQLLKFPCSESRRAHGI